MRELQVSWINDHANFLLGFTYCRLSERFALFNATSREAEITIHLAGAMTTQSEDPVAVTQHDEHGRRRQKS